VTVSTSGLQVPSLVDALHSAIRERILSGELPPGSPLTEIELATRYSVARPTAKAAVERLVHDGLLRRSSNKTARVPVLDAADILDLYYTREFLEREVVVALTKKKMVPDEARLFIKDLRAVGPDPVVTKVVGPDIKFHLSLVAEIGSPRLMRLYRSIMGELHLCMAQVQTKHLLSPKDIADEHVAIIAAIEAGDRRRAVQEMKDHLDRARVLLVRDVAARTA
jgi:DNA-binding GntR family transcriptional regulator